MTRFSGNISRVSLPNNIYIKSQTAITEYQNFYTQIKIMY